jgi:DUF1009 family protein
MIAGNGLYPATFAKAARAAGVEKLVTAAFINETEPSLEKFVDLLSWFRVGQLGKLIKFFRKAGIERAVMVGQIAPKNLYEFRPDVRMALTLAKLKERNAESLFGAIADELAKDGIELLPATTYLEDLLPGPGQVAGPTLPKNRLDDIAYGMRIAKEISRLDIGQTVVVKKGTVLAVEAFEGTNEAINRGGALGKGGATMIKVSKPEQDFRFDVPVVGPDTVRTAATAGIDLIVIEAGKTLILGTEEVTGLCRDEKVVIWAEHGSSAAQ